ncbi:hypothetical protein D9M72_498020 [compost metagenome]
MGEHVAVVRIVRAGHLEFAHAFHGLERPEILLRTGVAQQQTVVFVSDQRVRRLGHAALLEIVGRPADHALAIHDATHAQVRIFEDAELERDVDAFREDIDIVVRQTKPHFDVGILVMEFGNARCNQAPTYPQGSGNLQRPLRIAG